MKKHFIPLRRRIEDAGFGQRELAEMIGVSQSTLSNRLGCLESNPEWRGSEIMAICKVVGIPRSEIGELFFPNASKEVSA